MNRFVKIATGNIDTYIDQIVEIENLSFTSPWSMNAFKAEVKNPISHLWVVTEGKAIRGYLCFWMFDNEIQLINIAIHPNRRGQRLGHSLLNKVIETSISQGLRYIWLEVRPSNLAARGLYEKLGFQEISRRPRYYRDTNEDAIVMALKLTPRQRCNSAVVS